MFVSEFLDRIEQVTGKRPTQSSGAVSNSRQICPSHSDKSPSLSISSGSDGKILLNCHAGCTKEEICSSLGIEVADLFQPKAAGVGDRTGVIIGGNDLAILLLQLQRRQSKSPPATRRPTPPTLKPSTPTRWASHLSCTIITTVMARWSV